jgi:O-antigen/teichoic acid export membrane protein
VNTLAPPAPSVGRFRSHLQAPMYRTAYALLLNTGITSLLGLAYWAVAAHHYPAVDIGRASSAISALQLISGIAQCNLNNSLPRLIPTAGRGTSRLVARSYGATIALSILLAGGFALLAAHFGWAGGFLSQGRGYVIWFTVAVAAWTVFYLEDAVFTGLRQAQWVPVENTSFSIGKIVLLIALAGITLRFGVFGSFTIPVAITVFPVNWFIFRRLIPRHQELEPIADPGRAQPLRRYLTGEYVGGLANLATTTMLPLLVASEIGSVANAWFYSAWIVGSSFEYVLSSIAVSLVVEGASKSDRVTWAARRGALISGVVLLPSIALTLVAAPTVLHLVGSSYASHGTVVLRLVALAVLPRSVISLTVATARVKKDIGTMVAVQLSGCVLTIGLALALLPSLGLTGAGIAYAGGQALVALACLPRLFRILKPRHPGGPSPLVTAGAAPLVESAVAAQRPDIADLATAGMEPAATSPDKTATPAPRRRLDTLQVAGAVVALAVVGLTLAHAHLVGQPLLSAAFFLWVPGAAAVGWLDLDDRLLAAALSVGASIAIGTLVALAMLWTHTWHPTVAVVGLGSLCAVSLLALCARSRPDREATS